MQILIKKYDSNYTLRIKSGIDLVSVRLFLTDVRFWETGVGKKFY